jgi:inosine/xanthosine triphosphatase
MLIAVGSKNPAKLRAVKHTVLRVWPDAAIEGIDVPTGVSDMPMSDAECIDGARNRARAARKIADADLGIGLEGGVNQEPAGLMLLGWVVITHKDGREGIASTARLPLPTVIAERVLAGEELGPVMDDILNETRSNHRGGAIGALTAGLVPRTDAFAMAVAYALAPFVTPEYFQQPRR